MGGRKKIVCLCLTVTVLTDTAPSVSRSLLGQHLLVAFINQKNVSLTLKLFIWNLHPCYMYFS